MSGPSSWSGMRARASQSRQNVVVVLSWSYASSAVAGRWASSAHASAQYAASPSRSTWRARARPLSMPINRSRLQPQRLPGPAGLGLVAVV